MKREFEWEDGNYKMKIVVDSELSCDYSIYMFHKTGKQEWEYMDARHDWTGEMLRDGFGMLIEFLELGQIKE